MAERAASLPTSPVILLEGVRVRFQVVEDRVTSFKEYVLQCLTTRPDSHEHLALDGVDLTVGPGEMVGIVGRNGAGEDDPAQGRGRRPDADRGPRPHGRCGSAAPRGRSGFQPDLTGRENALLGMTMLGIRRNRATQLFDSVVDFAEWARRSTGPSVSTRQAWWRGSASPSAPRCGPTCCCSTRCWR